MRPIIAGIALLTLSAFAAGLTLIEPKDVAAQLAAKSEQPALFHVGPNLLYRNKHIPGSVYAGPGSTPQGIEMLKQAAAKLPRDRTIVLYCGCCPWNNCPNVKPAVEALQAMGFTKVKAMHIENNFAMDWTQKGYPVEEGSAR